MKLCAPHRSAQRDESWLVAIGPHTHCFISTHGDEGAAIGRKGARQHPACVTGERTQVGPVPSGPLINHYLMYIIYHQARGAPLKAQRQS